MAVYPIKGGKTTGFNESTAGNEDLSIQNPFHTRVPFEKETPSNVMVSAPWMRDIDPATLSAEDQMICEKRSISATNGDVASEQRFGVYSGIDASMHKKDTVFVFERFLKESHVDDVAKHIYEQIANLPSAAEGTEKSITFVYPNAIKEMRHPYNIVSDSYAKVLRHNTSEINTNEHLKENKSGIFLHSDHQARLQNYIPIGSEKAHKFDQDSHDPRERLVRALVMQPYFDTENLKELAGKNLMLTDDHAETGGRLRTLHSAIQTLNIDTKVIGFSALTAHPAIQDLRPNRKVSNTIHEDLTQEEFNGLQKSLGRIGLSNETLTPMEQLYILALVLDGKVAHDKQLFQEAYANISKQKMLIPEKETDLYRALALDSWSIKSIDAEITRQIENRSATFRSKFSDEKQHKQAPSHG